VQRRDEGDEQGGVAEAEDGRPRALQDGRAGGVAASGQAAVADAVGQADPEQRDQQQRVGLEANERRG
jgi:hypothetical protein